MIGDPKPSCQTEGKPQSHIIPLGSSGKLKIIPASMKSPGTLHATSGSGGHERGTNPMQGQPWAIKSILPMEQNLVGHIPPNLMVHGPS